MGSDPKEDATTAPTSLNSLTPATLPTATMSSDPKEDAAAAPTSSKSPPLDTPSTATMGSDPKELPSTALRGSKAPRLDTPSTATMGSDPKKRPFKALRGSKSPRLDTPSTATMGSSPKEHSSTTPKSSQSRQLPTVPTATDPTSSKSPELPTPSATPRVFSASENASIDPTKPRPPKRWDGILLPNSAASHFTFGLSETPAFKWDEPQRPKSKIPQPMWNLPSELQPRISPKSAKSEPQLPQLELSPTSELHSPQSLHSPKSLRSLYSLESDSQQTKAKIPSLISKLRSPEPELHSSESKSIQPMSELQELEKLKSELRQTKLELQQKKAQYSQMSNDLEEMAGQDNMHETEIEGLKERFRERVVKGIKDETRLMDMEEEHKKITAEKEDMQKKLDAFEHKKVSQSNQVSTADRLLHAERKKVVALETDAKNTEVKHQSTILALRKKLQDSGKFIQTSDGNIEETQAHIDGLQEAKKQWEESSIGLEEDLAKLKATLEDKERTINEMTEQNKKLKDEKKHMKSMITQLEVAQSKSDTGYSTEEDGLLKRTLDEELEDIGGESGIESEVDGGEEDDTITRFGPDVATSGGVEPEKSSSPGQSKPKSSISSGTQTDNSTLPGLIEPKATKSSATQTEEVAPSSGSQPEELTIPGPPEPETVFIRGKKPWYAYLYKHPKPFFGVLIVMNIVLLVWALWQAHLAMKERNMWIKANDHAHRLKPDIIRRQAVRLLRNTPLDQRGDLGWLTPARVMKLYSRMLAKKFVPLTPTRTITSASQTVAVAPPTPATEYGFFETLRALL